MRTLLAIAIVVAAPAHAEDIVFVDTFDEENGGVGILNYGDFAKWTVSDGFVDLIGNGFNDFLPGNGLYLDLDGSGADAGVLTSELIELEAGDYRLQFELGENSGEPVSNSMTVSVGAFLSATLTSDDANNEPPTFVELPFTVGADTQASIVFDHDGGDNFGLLIDDVRLIRGCPADVNGDEVLNILDFVAFQSLYLAADPCADCDGNGVFNILDFVCYQNLFQAGCD